MPSGFQYSAAERQAMHWTQSFERVHGLGLQFDLVGKGADGQDSWWDAMPSESNVRAQDETYNSLGLSLAGVQASVHAYSSHLASSTSSRFNPTFDDSHSKIEQSNLANIEQLELRNRCASIELFPELHMSSCDAPGRLQTSEMEFKEFGFDPLFPPTPEDELDYVSGWSSPYSDDRSTPSFVGSPEPHSSFVHISTPPSSAADAPAFPFCPPSPPSSPLTEFDSPSPSPNPRRNVQPEIEIVAPAQTSTPPRTEAVAIIPSLMYDAPYAHPTFFWSTSEVKFYPVSSRNDFSNFDEIVSFPKECFTSGSITQDEPMPVSNAFIRKQRCVGGCKFNFRDGAVKPVRLRAHFASCEPRKNHFAEIGVIDGFAKACELQLESLRIDRSQQQLGGSIVDPSTAQKRRASTVSDVVTPEKRVKV